MKPTLQCMKTDSFAEDFSLHDATAKMPKNRKLNGSDSYEKQLDFLEH